MYGLWVRYCRMWIWNGWTWRSRNRRTRSFAKKWKTAIWTWTATISSKKHPNDSRNCRPVAEISTRRSRVASRWSTSNNVQRGRDGNGSSLQLTKLFREIKIFCFRRTDLTPFMLFVKHNEKTETDKDKLKRQYNMLNDSDKLIWIQKAITAYEVRPEEFI